MQGNPSVVVADLEGVEMEDRSLVSDVIVLLRTLNLLKTYNINTVNKGYEILSWVPRAENEDMLIDFSDLQYVLEINRLRVQHVSVKIPKGNSGPVIRVIVLSHATQVMLEEHSITRIQKRKRWA